MPSLRAVAADDQPCDALPVILARRKSADTREGATDERQVLVELIRSEVERLPGTDEQRSLRRAFITYRYAAELDAWKSRRGHFRLIFVLITVGTAALGVINSGLVTASSGKRSTLTDVVLVTIGVLVAVLAAVNSFLNPGQAAAEYRSDEFELRKLGWEYLGELEAGAEAVTAYAHFREQTSKVLARPHTNWFGRPSSPSPSDDA